MRFLLAICLCFSFSANAWAQVLSPQVVQVPMRDGANLAADLYLPPGGGSYPTILIQTPYDRMGFRNLGMPLGVQYDLSNSPYAFLVLDWRCFYGSTSACTSNVNRGNDGYDAVEWIAQQSWSDGNVGTWGPSALGGVQFLTARKQPPHLVCAIPEVVMPLTSYQGYYPGGILSTMFYQTLNVLYANIGGFGVVLQNPYDNFVWDVVENSSFYPDSIQVPMLLVGGWYDHNTWYYPELFERLRTESAPAVRSQHRMLMGPWVHGGTGFAAIGTSQQGELNFQDAAGAQRVYERQFADYHLRGLNNGWDTVAPVRYYRTGQQRWTDTTHLPNSSTVMRLNLVKRNGVGELTSATASEQNEQSFSSDPMQPSPTLGGKTLSLAVPQGPTDHSSLLNAPGHLYFETKNLDGLTLSGAPRVVLRFKADVTDVDLCVRLLDVYPDGRRMLIDDGCHRARFINGFTQQDEQLLTPGSWYTLDWELPVFFIHLAPGHRLGLLVSGSNYPLYNRNMQTGGEMYPNQNADTLVNPQVAQISLDISGQGSFLELPGPKTMLNVESYSPKASEVHPFPNPGREGFRLGESAKGLAFTLWNVQGRLVMEGVFGPMGGVRGLEYLTPGLYLLRWTDADGKPQRSTWQKVP